MCRLRNIAMRDYQESVTTGQTDRHTHTHTGGRAVRQTPDIVIPMCRYASQATQKGRDMTRSYDKSPYTNRKFKKGKRQHKTPPKTRLHKDCEQT